MNFYKNGLPPLEIVANYFDIKKLNLIFVMNPI